MKNKAYIVANEPQEREVLDKLEREGFTWFGGDKPTENRPSKLFKITIFPYIIFVGKNTVTWNLLSKLEDEEIVFDGRKEECMSEKYVVSQEFMNELEEWKLNTVVTTFINGKDIKNLPYVINDWWFNFDASYKEYNNRLIAIIRWVNGEDVFEVEKPKKWVVRSKGADALGRYGYLDCYDYVLTGNIYERTRATKFDTKEEAESWANSHQEVIEVVDV